MSHRRCAAKTCFNRQGCRTNLKFFCFPKDEISCRLWARNSGREDLLDRPIEQLHKLLLCADHFESYWFLNPKYKTAFIRTAQPIPTIFHNNLSDFVPKSLQKNVASKILNSDLDTKLQFSNDFVYIKSAQTSDSAKFIETLKDGDLASKSQNQLMSDTEDYSVEINIDLDSYEDDASIMGGCHKMCRLCAHLVYEYKLISIFSSDKLDLVNRINKYLPISEGDGLPETVCNTCIDKLNECDSVIQNFIAADMKLRSLFRFQNTDFNTFMEEGTEEVSPDGSSLSETSKKNNSTLLPALAEFVTLKETVLAPSADNISGINHFEDLQVKQENTEVETEITDVKILQEEIANVNFESANQIKAETLEVDDWPMDDNSNDNLKFSDISPNSKMYSCPDCKVEFNERNKFFFHQITEHVCREKDGEESQVTHKKYKREQMTCRVCGEVFSGKKPLRRHVKEQHIPAENICEFCGAHYQIKSQLEVHRRLHTDEKPFSCQVCQVNFHFKKELQRHKRTYHNQTKSLVCNICNKSCANRNAMWRHEKTHTDDRNVLCYLCGKVLSNPQSLRVHMRTHSSERPCSCPTCGKSFKDQTSVSKHMLMHSTIKNFACDVCGRAFYSNALVKQHKLSHSGIKPHKCETCGAAYNRLGNLNQHKKKHASDLRSASDLAHECVVCGKKMRSELTLKYHLAKHTGEKKPFDCEVCGKRFIAVDPYRVHMRIHTGERPYQCTVCGKTFRSSFTLKQHSGLHRDECPYACPYCERRFKRLQSLFVHKRTHTGEKPHICQLCGRGFAQKGDMLKHTKTHLRDRSNANNNMKSDGIIMKIEHISELGLSDSDITSEFLIDMPIVEVETEIQSEGKSDINSAVTFSMT